MKVSCQQCGKLFDAQRRNAQFCGTTCRKRSSDRDIAARKNGELAPVSTISPPETPAPPPQNGLLAATMRELEEAGVLDSVLGYQALRLAEKMLSHFDTGSATASVSREFRAVMAEALASGTKKADGLDELAARRHQKAAG